MQKLKKIRRKHKKNKKKQKQKQKNSKENTKNRKNRNLPARPLEIFIFRGGSWAGNPVFLFFLFSFEFFCFFSVSFCFLCFRLVFLSFCIYNRKNTYKNRKQQNNSKENFAADLKVVCIIYKQIRKGASRLGESPFLA